MGVEALPPGSTIGILGSGQLGRMIALAASPLGFRAHAYSPTIGPTHDVCAEGTLAKYEDKAALEVFAKSVDVITYEFENIPVETVKFLTRFCPVRPNPTALEVSQDRLSEKTFLEACGAEVAQYRAVDTQKDLMSALQEFNGNGVLKTRRFGYDGKGQIMLRAGDKTDFGAVLDALGNVPLILEELVSYSSEVSVIAVRGIGGEIRSFDAAENTHENHILKTSTVPADLPQATKEKASRIAGQILTKLDYVGSMGIEFFVVKRDGSIRLLVNEIAPRVHNSGHWTMDACGYSQFDQHVRAICGWPLQSTQRHFDAVMYNLLGDDIKDWLDYAGKTDTHFHDYAKREARVGRKMGHVNVLSSLSKSD